ncbi:MAG: filamentous hemagglutinin N-terminal domain-containing protein [Deltaproteobacteria bacterium]|nr:filamentous hemagglutinin N-terminal domain-containing protein [Deltaproteobacteria bacterium]
MGLVEYIKSILSASNKMDYVLPAIIILSSPFFMYSTCSAGITLDGSLGKSGALTGPNYAITPDLGRQMGGNLFHSFGTFNLNSAESATFTGPVSVENIISRVTGGSASNIDGLVRSGIQGANFYFINPSGIVFGPNVKLDVSGSFHASTADYIKLGSDGRFDAKQPDNSVLTSAPPSAFGFLGPNPAGITIQGSFLQVAEEKTLSIVGGDVTIENGYLFAPGGRVNVAAVASAGEVVPGASGLNVDGFKKLGKINILHSTADRAQVGGKYIGNIDASGTGGGSVFIRGGKLVADNSWISADTYGEKAGVRVDINIKGDMTVSNDSLITSDTYGTGKGGDIKMKTVSLILNNGGAVQAVTNKSGNAGGILINTGKLSISGGAGITTNSNGTGKGGNLTIHASKGIRISGDNAGSGLSVIYSNAFSSGKGGTINISTPSLSLSSGGLIQATTDGSGDAGGININAGVLAVTGGAQINTSSKGTGNGGNIVISASDSINISGYRKSDGNLEQSTVYSNASGSGDGGSLYVKTPFLKMSNLGAIQAAAYDKGDSGYVSVETGRLAISGGANIDTSSYGEGLGGSLSINAKDYVSISGADSGLFSNSMGTGVGGFIYVKSPVLDIANGGGVHATTFDAGSGKNVSFIFMELGKLTLSAGGFIDSSSYGLGTGGYLLILATDSVNISGHMSGKSSGLYSSSEGGGPGGLIYVQAPLLDIRDRGAIDARTSENGSAGDIVAEVGSMRMRDRASISVQSLGTGLAGNIVITASNNVELRDSSMTAATENADGGNIHISAKKLLDLNDSSLTATVKGGTGNGGNIIIDPENVVLDKSRIIANADRGDGGNISIASDNYFSSLASVVSASSRMGLDGTVVISSPAIDITGNLTVLPASFLRADALFPKPCAAGEEEMSSFVLKGRDGLPPLPDSLR